MNRIAWALGEDVAPIVRFLQDQPAIYCWDPSGKSVVGNFLHDVGDWIEQAGVITRKHREMFGDIIYERGWEEPPRWKAFSLIEHNKYFVYVCPGAGDTHREINDLCKARPDGMDCHLTIGGFFDRTWTKDDPILHRSTYVTRVWQLVARARERGLIIGPDRERPPYEPIRCQKHRREPDFVRESEEAVVPFKITDRVTPEPLAMLVEMRDGTIMRERMGDWSEISMHRPDGSERFVMTRALNRLLQTGFIERVGERPPGYPEKVLEFDWEITPAGLAWMSANPNAVRRAAKKYASSVPRKSVTEGGK